MEVAAEVAEVPGVGGVGAISSLTTTARVAGGDRAVDVVAYGYDRGAGRLPAPPSAGGVVVDRRLGELVPSASATSCASDPRVGG